MFMRFVRGLHWRPILPPAFLPLLLFGQFADETWAGLARAGRESREAGRLPEAETLLQRALLLTPTCGEKDHGRAATLNHLGVVSHLRGDHIGAAGLFQQAIACYRSGTADPPPVVVDIMANYATALRRLGRLQESAVVLRQAADLESTTFAGQPAKSDALANALGWLAVEQGRYGDARVAFEQELQLLGARRAGGPSIGRALSGLGHVAFKQGNYALAESYYRRALELRRKSLPAGHLEIYQTMASLGVVLGESGQRNRAERILRESLRGMESSPLIHEFELAAPLNNLAGLLVESRKYVEAERHAQRAVRQFEQHGHSNSPGLLEARLCLAIVLRNAGRSRDAENLLVATIRAWEQYSGGEHPLLVRPLQNLAVLLTLQKRYAEAEPLFLRAVSLAESKLGSAHHDLAVILASYAKLLKATGRGAQATAARRRAESIASEARPDLAGALSVDFRELKK